MQGVFPCRRPRGWWSRPTLSALALLGLVLLCTNGPGSANAGGVQAASTITSIRAGVHAAFTRVVIDVTEPVAYELTRSDDDGELRVTLLHAVPAATVPVASWSKSRHVKAVQLTPLSPTSTRATIVLKDAVRPKLFTLEHPSRVVIDLYPQPAAAAPAPKAAAPAPQSSRLQSTARSLAKTIVIDPGHGGKDPGAIGRSGLKEKTVVLDIGRRLKKLLEAQGHHVIMTREDDTFIPLPDRTALANSRNADLYISVHANASRARSVKGVEIYLLGQASDASARATAARENGDDSAFSSDLDLIFHDMELDYRINHSISLAHLTRSAFVQSVGKRYDVVDLGVKRAPFFVLMKSTMPGILAEVSFISNPKEESRLKKASFRQNVAEALAEGVQKYLRSTDIES